MACPARTSRQKRKNANIRASSACSQEMSRHGLRSRG
jgi:hypothetical protein